MSPFRASAALTDEWKHFDFAVQQGVATITLNRPDKLNALTFDIYADLRDLLAELPHRGDARVLVIAGEGRGFCSGGDVEEIIGALQDSETAELLEFTRMTGGVVKALRGRRRSGDRAGQRLSPAGRVGVVRIPVHSRRPGRGRHGLRLPVAADRRARTSDRAADPG
jgi:hypothetical protein